MQFVEGDPVNPFSRVLTTHNNDSIKWDLGFYSRTKGVDCDGVFRYINEYFASLDIDTQQKIYDSYARISECIYNVLEPNLLHQKLTQEVAELYKHISFEGIKHYVIYYSNIKVPPSIRSSYNELEISERGKDYQKLTYLRDDYIDLIILAVYMKPMVPIWSEYARLLDKSSGNSNFREYRIMSMFNDTEVPNTAPIHRLRTYIEASLEDRKNKGDGKKQISAVLGGLGSSEMPDWLLAQVCIRKLAIIELSSIDDKNKVVSVVYHHINNTVKSIDRNFKGWIRSKPKPSGDTEGDDVKSVIETYKIKQVISDGDMLILSIFTESPYRLAERIDSTIPKEYVEACSASMHMLEDSQPTEGQLTVVRWVISPVLSPRSVDNIKKTSLLNCFAAAQAALWHWGMYDLAKLLTSRELKDDRGMLLGGIESKTRIPKEYIEVFIELYAHYPEKGKREINRQTNVACKTVDNISKDFIKCDWYVTAPDELSAQGTPLELDRTMRCPGEIRAFLSQLIMKLLEYQKQAVESQPRRQ